MEESLKQLLLKDLCARLPYMPKIKIIYQQQGIKGTDEENVSCDFIEKIVNDLRNGVITDMQIYLRPISNITEEEKIELCTIAYAPDEMKTIEEKLYVIKTNAEYATDFYNKHHFDYRGLIEKGLALEAPNDMYK